MLRVFIASQLKKLTYGNVNQCHCCSLFLFFFSKRSKILKDHCMISVMFILKKSRSILPTIKPTPTTQRIILPTELNRMPEAIAMINIRNKVIPVNMYGRILVSKYRMSLIVLRLCLLFLYIWRFVFFMISIFLLKSTVAILSLQLPSLQL